MNLLFSSHRKGVLIVVLFFLCDDSSSSMVQRCFTFLLASLDRIQSQNGMCYKEP